MGGADGVLDKPRSLRVAQNEAGSKKAALAELWSMITFWPETVLVLLLVHVAVRWIWLALHAYFISKKLEA